MFVSVASTREMVCQLNCSLQYVQMAASTTIVLLRGLPEVCRESYVRNFLLVCCVDNFVLLTVHPRISPTRCTILVNISISLHYMFRTSVCPSSGENYWSYATLVVSICVGGVWSIQPADHMPPMQSDKYKCRIDTVISPDDGHMVARSV